jgi:putative PIN family toxin of toxin-antitoxin system
VIRAVIDTNVLVSGLLSASGNEALTILAIHQELVTPCFSAEIIEEYAAVLARRKFSFPPEQIAALIAMLERVGERFNPVDFSVSSPDPADSKFLHCAMVAQADFIVTGNRRDFPDSPYGRTRVVSAGELLDWITLGT